MIHILPSFHNYICSDILQRKTKEKSTLPFMVIITRKCLINHCVGNVKRTNYQYTYKQRMEEFMAHSDL